MTFEFWLLFSFLFPWGGCPLCTNRVSSLWQSEAGILPLHLPFLYLMLLQLLLSHNETVWHSYKYKRQSGCDVKEYMYYRSSVFRWAPLSHSIFPSLVIGRYLLGFWVYDLHSLATVSTAASAGEIPVRTEHARFSSQPFPRYLPIWFRSALLKIHTWIRMQFKNYWLT